MPDNKSNVPIKDNNSVGKFNIIPLVKIYVKLLSGWLGLWGLGYFRFSPSWIVMGALSYLVYARAKEKRSLISSSLRAIGKNEKQSIISSISAHELPSWVYFPDIERADWLNKVIKRMWPFITDYIRDILLNSVQPAVDKSLPSTLRPFVFNRTDLGDTSPRIGGVKVYMEESIDRDEIVMDIDLMFYSDADIKISVAKVLAGVKEFELRGTLRILMKPLVSKIPFAGAVTVCFLDNPYVNFTLTNVGNILNIPGLQQTLKRTIQDAVSSLCVLPNRISVPLVDEVSLQQLKYPSPEGIIRVHVISASNLVAADVNVFGKDTSDPYCIVRVGAQKFSTSVVEKTCNPRWNEIFEAIIDQRFGQSVQIEVWDKDKSNKDDELGRAFIPVDIVYQKGQLEMNVTLEGIKHGSIHLKLYWMDMSSRTSDFEVAQKEVRALEGSVISSVNTSCLFVRVERAQNLRRLKFIQEPSAYCILQLGNITQNTVVKERTQNPIWESTHTFLFSNPEIHSLNIEVRDSHTEYSLGTISISLKLLLSELDMTITHLYSLSAAGPDNALIYLHLELRALVIGPEHGHVMGPESDINSPSITIVAEVDRDVTSRSEEAGLDVDISNLARTRSQPQQRSSDLPQDMSVKQRASLPQNPTELKQPNSHSPISSASSKYFAVPTNPIGRLRVTLHYDDDMQTLQVTIHRAADLIGVDKDGLADPYVKLYIIGKSVKSEQFKTQVVKNYLNPVFEESFDFHLKPEELVSCMLRLDVNNHVGWFSKSGSTKNMGSITIDLKHLDMNVGFTEWYWLSSNSE